MNHHHKEEEADHAEASHAGDSAHDPELHEHTQKDSPVSDHTQHQLLMALLSYMGPLVIVSYAFAKNDSFVAFHIRQGLLLLIAEVASWMLAVFIWPLAPLLQLINLVILIFAIIGIVNVVQGKERELPVVGSWGKAIQF